MCGIAGIIHRGKSSNVGQEMTSMLRSLKHRGPDSTGFAVYGANTPGDYVMRFVLAEQEDMSKGFDMKKRAKLYSKKSGNFPKNPITLYFNSLFS